MNRILLDTLLGRKLNEFETKNAPDQIHIEGPMKLPLRSPRVAIIGTRKPTEEGVEETRSLTKKLVDMNVTIVSGLAAGVDTVAHTTAIEEGGQTIAVLGTPLNRTYPVANRSLQQEIARNHLVISQFPTERPVYKGNFVARNRTMALIADATVIVEASETSGTIHQGWEAIRLCRPLFVCDLVVQSNPQWLGEMMQYGDVYVECDKILDKLPQRESYVSVFA